LNSLELALERYLLFTTGLPPFEAVQKWLQLQKQSSPKDRFEFIANDLKQAGECNLFERKFSCFTCVFIVIQSKR
jgi:hypothetical protein